jgi:ribose 5-phosphate isomerase B
MSITIGSDHAGFQLKEKLIKYLQDKEYKIEDSGCYSEESVDYPDYAHKVALAIQNKTYDYGILICGTGNGCNICANRYTNIRSGLCWNSEIASLVRQHNDANILVLPARFITDEEAYKCVDIFFSTKFEGGRHTSRIKKIDK